MAITAGQGSLLADRAAARVGLTVCDLVGDLASTSHVTPAFAVARLLAESCAARFEGGPVDSGAAT
jgi:uncharacterized hydantoinase/oxoprolinase family protein